MISHEQFTTRWHYEPLVCASEQATQNLCLPDEQTRFLTEVGLPCETHFLVGFQLLKAGLPGLPAFVSDSSLAPLNHLRVLGAWTSAGMQNYVCLDSACDGQIVSFDVRERTSQLFNSSVAQLAESILLFTEALETMVDVNEDEAMKRIDDVAHRLQVVDAPAFSSDSNIWPIMISEVANSLP